MRVIHYNPLTFILINAKPSIGIVGNWNCWTNQEDFLIQTVKKANPKNDFTMINFIKERNYMNPLSEKGLLALGTKNGFQTLLQYFCPSVSEKKIENENFFEPFKSMFHFQKVYIFKDHPAIPKLINVLGSQKVIIVDNVEKDDWFCQKIQEALKSGNLKTYNSLVGANFDFSGQVVKGKQLGRTIGYPTANIRFEQELPLRLGVYLVKVRLPNDKQEYWGMADYWKNPATGLTFETYIFDFNHEIYGWIINVEVLVFYRDHFPITNLKDLKKQLDRDQLVLKKLLFDFKEK